MTTLSKKSSRNGANLFKFLFVFFFKWSAIYRAGVDVFFFFSLAMVSLSRQARKKVLFVCFFCFFGWQCYVNLFGPFSEETVSTKCDELNGELSSYNGCTMA